MNCEKCASPYRLTHIYGMLLCYECEKDESAIRFGLISKPKFSIVGKYEGWGVA